ncbi:MAG: hypothetical protein ACLFRI_04845 [Candidatus Izemoplasmataceae bacterium]
MTIKRLTTAHPYFSEDTIKRGLAFLVLIDEEEIPYTFSIINHHEAKVLVLDERFVDEVIEVFLDYSGHISKIVDQFQTVRFLREKVPIYFVPIEALSMSQFYISKDKLETISSWAKNQDDFILQVMATENELILADGHTRLKLAKQRNFTHVYVYKQRHDPLLMAFHKEALKRKIKTIDDVSIIEKDAYEEKWHRFCNKFIKSYEKMLKGGLK